MVRCSQMMNAAKKAIPPKSVTTITGSPKPRRGASISAKTGPASPTVQSRRRRRSRLAAAWPWRSITGTTVATSAAVTSANGTLMMNTHRQDACVTSQPPASGPITNAIPVHDVQVPIAAPRSSPLKVEVITASPAGVSSAPVTP